MLAYQFAGQTVPCYDCPTAAVYESAPTRTRSHTSENLQNSRRPPAHRHRIGNGGLCGAGTATHLHAGTDGNGLPHLDAGPHRYAPPDLDAPPHLDTRTYHYALPDAHPVPHLDTGAYGHAIPYLDAGAHRNGIPHAYAVSHLDAGAYPNPNSGAIQLVDLADGHACLYR